MQGRSHRKGGAHGVCAFDCDACASSCQVVFDNDKRQTIATSILKKKKQQEKKEAAKGGKEDALVAGQTKFSQFLSNAIETHTVRECQHSIPGRSRDDLLQDIGSKVSLSLLGDPISTDLSVQRGLQQIIPRTTSVNFRGVDSKQTAQPKSITQARAELRGAKMKKKSGDTLVVVVVVEGGLDMLLGPDMLLLGELLSLPLPLLHLEETVPWLPVRERELQRNLLPRTPPLRQRSVARGYARCLLTMIPAW